jgi:hypothetical protein
MVMGCVLPARFHSRVPSTVPLISRRFFPVGIPVDGNVPLVELTLIVSSFVAQ